MKFQNKELYDYLQEKDKLVAEAREKSKQIEDLESERNKIALQVQKIKDKVIPIVEEITEGQLGEWEAIEEVKPTENENEVEVTTFDQVEEYKKFLLEKKNEEKVTETEDGTPSPA